MNAKGFKAPPYNDRPISLQEAETVLCKFKSFKHEHYYVGKDVDSVTKALLWCEGKPPMHKPIVQQLLQTALKLKN